MPILNVMPEGKQYDFASGKNLMEIMLDAGLFIDNACGGKGLCGKCRVRITEGNAGEAGETERGILKAEEIEQGVRLACLAYPASDITIELLQKEKKHDVLASGYMPDFSFEPDIVKVPVTIHKPTLADQTPFENQIIEQVGAEALVGHDGATGYLGFDYTALSESSMLPGEYTAVIHDGKVIALEPGDTAGSLYGVAIDIGTTTVVCSLVDMLTGEELGHASEINAQKFFGLDVLTRITYIKGPVRSCFCARQRRKGFRHRPESRAGSQTLLPAFGIRIHRSGHRGRSICLRSEASGWQRDVHRHRNERRDRSCR